MVEKDEKTIYLDPRTVLLLLVFVTVVVFSRHSLYIELVLVTALLGLFLCCGLFKSGLKFVLVFGFLLTFQYYIFPVVPKIFADIFSFLTAYSGKVFPCLMIGTFIIQITSMRYLVLAMRKWHFPQKLIIPLSVTIRYFPAIREGLGHNRDAMKLRWGMGAAKV